MGDTQEVGYYQAHPNPRVHNHNHLQVCPVSSPYFAEEHQPGGQLDGDPGQEEEGEGGCLQTESRPGPCLHEGVKIGTINNHERNFCFSVVLTKHKKKLNHSNIHLS